MFIWRELGGTDTGCLFQFTYCVLVHRLARAAGFLSTLTGNIESGQNVSRPVITRGNIGDDAVLLRRT